MNIAAKIVKVDFVLQSIVLLGFNPLLILSALVSTGGFNVVGLLAMQFIIGAYQFLTAFAHYFRSDILPDIKQKRTLHLILSVLVLLGVLFGFTFTRQLSSIFNTASGYLETGLTMFFGIIAPQGLAYYYYWITYQDNKEQKKSQ